MKKFINTFEGAMDMDSPFTNYPNTKYYKAKNLEISKIDGNANESSIKFVNGNILAATLGSSYRLHGKNAYTQLGDKLVFITIGAVNDTISHYTINSDGTLSDFTTVWTGDMNLDSSYPIKKIIGFYESDSLQKIYWTDGYNRLRFCNIADPDLASVSASDFDVIPSYSLNQFEITSSRINEISGNLKTGVIQYTYRLYNKNGNQTLFFPPTDLYPIYPKISSSSSDIFFVGGEQGANSGKGLGITVTALDTDYDYIQIYRIYYANKNSDPEIGLVYDSEYSSTLYFEDVGTTLNTISYQEFQFGSYDFICQALGTKNNVLFAGNVEENLWDIDETDFDARAYRFNNSLNNAILFDSTYTKYIALASSGAWTEYNYGTWTLTGESGTNWSIPKDYDCINAFNDQANAPASVYPQTTYCEYNPAISAKGGYGKYISFRFGTTSLGTPRSTGVNVEEYFNGYTGPTEKKSYQRDEIYSFSIVLYNNKGQKSNPFWVCDIRMPSTTDYPLVQNDIESLYPVFTINSAGRTLLQNLGCTDYRIVRCERGLEDKTIIAQGLIGGTRKGVPGYSNIRAGYSRFSSVGEMGQASSGDAETGNITDSNSKLIGVIDRTLLEFISPEIFYTDDVTFESGDYLRCVALPQAYTIYYNATNDINNSGFKGSKSFSSGIDFSENYDNVILIRKCHRCPTSLASITTLTTSNVADIEISDFKIISEGKKADDSEIEFYTIDVGGTPYYNYTLGYQSSSKIQGTHGTCAILKASNYADSTYLPVNKDTSNSGRGIGYYLFNYKRDIIPYGGHTYEARKYRKYIPCGTLMDVSTGTGVTAANIGDVYITPFEYTRTMVSGNIGDINTDESYLEVISFYCESSINTRATKNKTLLQRLTNGTNSTINYSAALSHEQPGVYNNENSDIVYTQENPLYEYNNVYSKENNIIKHYPDIFGNNEKSYSGRIHYSERKEIGEIIDSWSVWKTFNYKDLDVNQGEIVALPSFKNDIYAFQTRGVSVLSVDERVLVGEGTAQQATLGTGSVLARYDYLSKQSGTSYPNSISVGKFGIYYFDDNYISYNVVNNGNTSITKLSGVQSYLNTMFSDASAITDVYTGVDQRFDKVFFTNDVSGLSEQTIIYDEMKKQFVSVSDRVPEYYVTTDKFLYTYHLNTYGLYFENSRFADTRTFYGTREEAKLSFVINPAKGFISRFDILEWTIHGIVNDSLTNFNKIRFYNSYQDSGEIDLTASNLFQLFRKYRFNQIFTSNSERFKDEFMVVELICDEDTNNQINLNNVISTYSTTAPF